MDLLTADKGDAAALESLRAEQLKLAEDGSRRLTQAIAEASQVLTPAQRREFASRLSGRQSRWHGWG